MSEEKVCEICGATTKEYRKVCYCKRANKVLCSKHQSQFNNHGRFLDYTIYDKNKYIIKEDRVEIELRNKQGKIVGYAIIDPEDMERCEQHKWYLNAEGYVKTIINNKQMSMHRYILGYSGTSDVDHINRNKSDNRKANLRIVSRSENVVNRCSKSDTGYKNITKTKYDTYQVNIVRDFKHIYNKRHKTLQEAIAARDKAIAEYNESHNRAC